MAKPFFVTIPHSGESIPYEAHWLQDLPETIKMCDVDRFVDVLYEPILDAEKIPNIVARWHRYAADLNRLPDDIDQASVEDAPSPKGTHPIGFHWSVTTRGDQLMPSPISRELHNKLVEEYWRPFHTSVEEMYEAYFKDGHKRVFQLDAHSMPSLGTEKHRDPGETRAQIVISDQDGKSCDSDFKDLVVNAYKNAGLEVKMNWPYKGGRVTQTYGNPKRGQNCIQVEISRALYMDEESKQLVDKSAAQLQKKLSQAIGEIWQGLENLV